MMTRCNFNWKTSSHNYLIGKALCRLYYYTVNREAHCYSRSPPLPSARSNPETSTLNSRNVKTDRTDSSKETTRKNVLYYSIFYHSAVDQLPNSTNLSPGRLWKACCEHSAGEHCLVGVSPSSSVKKQKSQMIPVYQTDGCVCSQSSFCLRVI